MTVTIPVDETPARRGFDDSHVAAFVTSRAVPSDIRAEAVSLRGAAPVDALVTTTVETVAAPGPVGLEAPPPHAARVIIATPAIPSRRQ
jgi:hypothetical protein